jgi:AcrR family transcriptional regulator
MTWVERAADRSPAVQRSRNRGMQQAKVIVDAARRLMANGSTFTTQELVKDAGVALKTFYRYFASKDQLLLAAIEDMVSESCENYEEQARDLPDPLDRLRYYITTAASSFGDADPAAQFISAEHWRLHQLYPVELAQATKPFTDLVLRDIHVATEAGLIRPADSENDAWLINQLVVAVHHHYAFAPNDEPGEKVANRLWAFCLGALGGRLK